MDETALNAKRWVYASFFNRMKRQVAQNWDPQTVWRRNDPSGSKNGFKTRITEVRVTLSAKGDLSKVVVDRAVGRAGARRRGRAFVPCRGAVFRIRPTGSRPRTATSRSRSRFHFEIGGAAHVVARDPAITRVKRVMAAVASLALVLITLQPILREPGDPTADDFSAVDLPDVRELAAARAHAELRARRDQVR